MSGVPLLRVEDLCKHYRAPRSRLFQAPAVHPVVDGVSLRLDAGQTLGLVGESGSGKSTTGQLLMRLLPATRGKMWLDGTEVLETPLKQFAPWRPRLQMVFQDPGASFNPAFTIAQSLEEPLRIHQPLLSGAERSERVAELLEQVGLRAAHGLRRVHEFSGGQRQRIGIARALALNPRLIIADEPVSALDVSVQSQVLNLLKDLQERHDIAYLFIAHDLAVVKHMSDQVAVMLRGRIVEYGSREQVYAHPLHPYTRLLLDSVPRLRQPRAVLTPPGPAPWTAGAQGCAFLQRCNLRTRLCAQAAPLERDVGNGHRIACHQV